MISCTGSPVELLGRDSARHSEAAEEALLSAARFERFQAGGALECIEALDATDTAKCSVPATATQLVAHLRMETHRIEKGLSLSEVRHPFGDLARRRIEGALAQLDEINSAGGLDAVGTAETRRQAEEALAALSDWNEHGQNSSTLTRPLAGPTGSFHELLTGRHSVRSFDREHSISNAQVETAVHVAMRSPSVCNRAAGRVHVFRNEAQIGAIFALQQGNRGLDGVTHLAVVTVELGMFSGASELVQPWIDGGLFLMNLVWGFQAQGIGTCLLNWSMPDQASTHLREMTGIPESESIVCLLAFGIPIKGSLRTRSAKPDIDTILTHHS